MVRPGTLDFIKNLSDFYELIIFTASLKEYADWIINKIDVDKKISHRLYREHTIKIEGDYVKDIAEIGRDITKTIIIDNNPKNFRFHPENGIQIKSWY